MATTQTSATPARFELVSLDRIEFYPQVRDVLDLGKIALMRRSLETGGLFQPVVLRECAGGKYTPTDGHYRVAAAIELKWLAIPSVIETAPRDEAGVIGAQLATAECRFPLNPMERARAYDEFLRRSRKTAAELAALIGVSEAQVSKTRALIGIRDDLQTLVASGRLAPSVALKLNHVTEPQLYESLRQRASVGELTRADFTEPWKRHRHRRAMAHPKKVEIVTITLSHRCRMTVPAGCEPEQLLAVVDAFVARLRQAKGSAKDLPSLIAELGGADLA